MPNTSSAFFSKAQQLVYETKTWGAPGDSITWRKLATPYFPLSYSSRIPLVLDDGAAELPLFLDLYYKPNILEGLTAAFTAALVLKETRILAVDTGLAAAHLNKVGQDESFYHLSVEHPHLHRMTEDTLTGYAEPLPGSDIEDLWEDFLLLANILDAPALVLPEKEQGELLL